MPIFIRLCVMSIVFMPCNMIVQAAEPWSNTDCEKLAKNIRNTTKIPVSISIEKIDRDNQNEIVPEGYACIIKGQISGLNQSYSALYHRIQSISNSWTKIPELDADGAASSSWGVRKGQQELLIHFESDPPSSCDDTPVGYCKAPLKFWTSKIRVMAYQR